MNFTELFHISITLLMILIVRDINRQSERINEVIQLLSYNVSLLEKMRLRIIQLEQKQEEWEQKQEEIEQ